MTKFQTPKILSKIAFLNWWRRCICPEIMVRYFIQTVGEKERSRVRPCCIRPQSPSVIQKYKKLYFREIKLSQRTSQTLPESRTLERVLFLTVLIFSLPFLLTSDFFEMSVCVYVSVLLAAREKIRTPLAHTYDIENWGAQTPKRRITYLIRHFL